MKKMMKWAIIGVIIAIVIWTFWFLYSKSQPKIVMYNITQPTRIDMRQTAIANGHIEPRNEILIKPQISGIIDKIYKVAGQRVKKGEVIARINIIPDMGQLNSAESRVRIAKISLQQAERDYKRTEQLYKDKLVSKEDFEKAKESIMKVREEMQVAQDALDIVSKGVSQRTASISNTLVRSTIDGLILDIPIKVGNSVIMSNTFNEGTTIATVANMGDLIFRGNVDETEVGRLHTGMKVKLEVGALQDIDLSAVLEYISPKGTNVNGATQFEIKAAVNPLTNDSVMIRSGYSANAEIVLRKHTDVLAVPESLIQFKGAKTFINVLTSDAEAQPQQFKEVEVKTGMSDGVNIEILEGIDKDTSLRGSIVVEKDKYSDPAAEAQKEAND